LLADVEALVDGERQRRGLGQHLELADVDLDVTRGDLRVLVTLGARGDLAGDLDAVLGAQLVGTLGHLALAEHDLGHAAGVAQVDEDHSAVIAPPRHPAGERDGLAGLLGTQRAGVVGAKHFAGSSRACGDGRYEAAFADGRRRGATERSGYPTWRTAPRAGFTREPATPSRQCSHHAPSRQCSQQTQLLGPRSAPRAAGVLVRQARGRALLRTVLTPVLCAV